MSAPRFYISPESWNLEALELGEAEAHHAKEVLRMQEGDAVRAFNGEGIEVSAKLGMISRKSAELQVGQVQKSTPLDWQVHLAQAIPKGKNMDLIVQKATELGVASIRPILSERTVVKMDRAERAKKQEKWQRVAIEAAKQCGQNWLPKVHEPVSLDECFASPLQVDMPLVASLQPDARRLKEILQEVEEMEGKKPKSSMVFIGPEGDFTPAEVSKCRGAGCWPMGLGPIVLRTETAAIYSVSVLGHELS